MHEITGLLLAAGSGSRFGGQKLLARIGETAIIGHSADALSACDRVIAVVRPGDSALEATLASLGIEVVINPLAQRGMAASLACGVGASGTSAGWCILPADMPYVKRDTARLVVDALRAGAEIVAPFHQGRRGHPVGFCKACKDRLLALQGDYGAREILARASDLITPLEVDDPGILIDIDTPQDLMAMRKL
jgi:molybdenum cofactor cytidylyltransferase